MRHCKADMGAPKGRQRKENNGLPLGNVVKWLWGGKGRERLKEEEASVHRAAVSLNSA